MSDETFLLEQGRLVGHITEEQNEKENSNHFSFRFNLWPLAFCVINTNIRTEKPILKTYSMQEPVPYESDYFRRSDNILDGYTITVLNAEIVPYEEYAKKHQVTLPERGTDGARQSPIQTRICL